jgi:deoxyribodipyrimidine photo-lyase
MRQNSEKVSIMWFRRDLRIEDNTALHHALDSGNSVLPVFLFDTHILKELPRNDARVSFIYKKLKQLHQTFKEKGSGLLTYFGEPETLWETILSQYSVASVYCNTDYEPYARERDAAVGILLEQNNVEFFRYKDQVIFGENEILKENGKPYTVFTPYKNKWLSKFSTLHINAPFSPELGQLLNHQVDFPSLSDLGFEESSILVKDFDLSSLKDYASTRNLPAVNSTSYLSTHLRFGTVSIRMIIKSLSDRDEVFLGELIWREFFMQILYHYPQVVSQNFHSKYDGIQWRNREDEFELWCQGKTGYPLVDAGMRQLTQTGFMHNRVRLVTASFLCKHLLIDWRWGEAYFAHKLLDYELASNNGNWQWAAGTGCDAAPYFRIFNPTTQMEKFDKELKYVKTWIPEFGTKAYAPPMVDHAFARTRALQVYKNGINR